MKSELAIQRELNKCVKAIQSNAKKSNQQFLELSVIHQSLAWALETNAMAPMRCYYGLKRKKI